jgi:molybdopterin-guanine dinucleotide biosynthesis protein A
VDFSRRAGDPFFNVNRRQDLAEAERLLAKTGGAT